jgi:hypothetical protein
MGKQIVTGKITATGAAIDVPLGFKPKRVVIHNETTNIGLEWTDTMAASKGVKTVEAGTRSFIASGGIKHYNGADGNIALSGTVAFTSGLTSMSGTNTKFLTELKSGDVVDVPGVGASALDRFTAIVLTVDSDTSATLYTVAPATASGKVAYNTSGRAEGFTLGTDSINTSTNVLHYSAEQ